MCHTRNIYFTHLLPLCILCKSRRLISISITFCYSIVLLTRPRMSVCTANLRRKTQECSPNSKNLSIVCLATQKSGPKNSAYTWHFLKKKITQFFFTLVSSDISSQKRLTESESGESGLVGQGIVVRIVKFLVQTPCAHPGLETQPYYEAPNDLQVENIKCSD